MQLARMALQLVDTRRQIQQDGSFDALSFIDVLDNAFDHFSQTLPTWFKLDSAALLGDSSTIDFRIEHTSERRMLRRAQLECWFFHQELFHTYLELCGPELATSVVGRLDQLRPGADGSLRQTTRSRASSTCESLSLLVLELQEKMRYRCPIVEASCFILKSSLKAAFIIMSSLCNDVDPPNHFQRAIYRAKLIACIKRCEHGHPYQTQVLRSAMDAEEVRWEERKRQRSASCSWPQVSALPMHSNSSVQQVIGGGGSTTIASDSPRSSSAISTHVGTSDSASSVSAVPISAFVALAGHSRGAVVPPAVNPVPTSAGMVTSTLPAAHDSSDHTASWLQTSHTDSLLWPVFGSTGFDQILLSFLDQFESSGSNHAV
ncbi:hypothetical protein OC845_002491 [Tilletia horrida]|nr:hypothetical protein OC845_002491 [Tilletia horrida]